MAGNPRVRPVKRFVQWPPHRQQLDGRVPDPGAFRGCGLCSDTAVPAREGTLPASWPRARPRPVPGDLLPGGVVHRGRIYRRLDVSARPLPGRITSRALGRTWDGTMGMT